MKKAMEYFGLTEKDIERLDLYGIKQLILVNEEKMERTVSNETKENAIQEIKYLEILKAYIMENIKVVEGSAFHSGGGIYIVLGKFNNGLYFLADNWSYTVFDSDVREYDEEYDFVGISYEWCEDHRVEIFDNNDIVKKAIMDFCKKLDNGNANEKGWENFQGHGCDVCKHIDFE